MCLNGVWMVSGWCLDVVRKVSGPGSKLFCTKFILGPKICCAQKSFCSKTSTKFVHIGDRLEQNCTNLTFQSLDIVQKIDKYSEIIGQIFCKHFVNIEANIRKIKGKIFYKYSALDKY